MSKVKSTTPAKEKDEWRTDPVLFALLEREFGPFHLDAAATKENALCKKFYTKEDNALVQPWIMPGVENVFLNPPFSMFDPFLKKAGVEADRGGRIVCIIRADGPETKWYTQNLLDTGGVGPWLYAPLYHIRNLVPRARYYSPSGRKTKGVMWPSAIVVMEKQGTNNWQPGVFTWYWKEDANHTLLYERT